MGKIPQIKKLEGRIQGLVRELEQLTPQPDHLSSLFNYNTLQIQNMPRRMGLERRIAACRRRLALIQNSHILPELLLAA